MSSDIKANLRLNNPFIALKHKNFRYFWVGQSVSLIGTWMQNIGQSWLVYTLTKSPLLLGIVGALQFTPMLFLSLFAGAIIDRYNKKMILMLTQSIAMLLALLLAILVQTDSVRYWHIVVLALALGLVNTFDMPTRQAFVIELVGKEDLMNAVALNSTVFNAARVIGPAVAGVLMGYMGIALCFFINAISFIPVIYGIYHIKLSTVCSDIKPKESIMQSVREGLVYIAKHDKLLITLLTTAIVGTFAMNFGVLTPVFAKTVLNNGETGFGLLMSAMGIGAFIGAMTMATKSKSGPMDIILRLNPIVISLLLILTGFAAWFRVAALLMAATGFFFVSFNATANSTMQLNSKDEFRGRVMSVYALVFGGSTPVGNLFAGGVTNKYGARNGFAACGFAIIVLFATLGFVKRKMEKKHIGIRFEGE